MVLLNPIKNTRAASLLSNLPKFVSSLVTSARQSLSKKYVPKGKLVGEITIKFTDLNQVLPSVKGTAG